MTDPDRMRPNASAGPVAFVALVLAVALLVPVSGPTAASGFSGSASTGGASASAAASASTSGGSRGAKPSGGGARYGSNVPRPARKPVVSKLTVSPRTVVAGSELPRLRFRVRQRGIERVRARVVVLRLPRNAPVARISLGWVKTGRQVTARWPKGVMLRRGRYLVRVHVKDSRGHQLRRTARLPGKARLRVRAPARAPAPEPPAIAIGPPSAPLPAPAASPGGRGVFPVAGAFSFGGEGSRFGAGRPGHIHQGQDIAAAAGTPVVAPYGGVVSSTSYQAGGAGEYVVLDAVDGRDYFFAHCIRRSTTVAEGTTVAAGAPLCQVGTTGTSSGPHLHFEIWIVGWRVKGSHPIDPLPELRAWAP